MDFAPQPIAFKHEISSFKIARPQNVRSSYLGRPILVFLELISAFWQILYESHKWAQNGEIS